MKNLIYELTKKQFSTNDEIIKLFDGLTIKDLHKIYLLWNKCSNSHLRGNKEAMKISLANSIKSTANHCVIRYCGVSEWDALTTQTKCVILTLFKYNKEERLSYINDTLVGDQLVKAKDFINNAM